ncbi:hypothetical protein [Dorea sp. D27]|uniref:hypothetical protein n=1 Tax=Dorea sp. D27 TaxID=658665 RepID=UPI0006A083E7|nr:hypothetical protein [Dorea sp. D27]KMZ55152.1 hypothetical protein HMPREF0980_00831 [Dorea sp. D27]
MPEKSTAGKNAIRIKEESILFKILRLLAEEHLISLEEELKGKELLQKEAEV